MKRLVLAAVVAVGCRTAAVKAPAAPFAVVSAEAARVEVSYDSGSCWGRSRETRVVVVTADGVDVAGAGGAPVHRSRAWWKATRALLNRGLAAATPRTRDNPSCSFRPNWMCGFALVVDGKSAEGCCSTHDAQDVVAAFRRLKPGGPLGPDLPPAD